MKRYVYFLVSLGMILVIFACNIGNPTPNPEFIESPDIKLRVQAQPPIDTLDTVGEVINFSYEVNNAGTETFSGPLEVSDTLATIIICPELTTFGDRDNALDPGETAMCIGSYSITQENLNAGAVTTITTASMEGGEIRSVPVSTTVTLGINSKTLGLAKSANPTTYSYVGQVITYNYVITNTGTVAIGPAQFTITDDRLGGATAPFACGPAGTVLEPAASVPCQATYTITQQDISATTVTNTAIASGGDAQASSPASATITNTIYLTPEVGGPSNLVPGSTIQHTVIKGEWLIQIARCYGVTYESLRKANLYIPNPSLIDPGLIVTVPNIGSAGTIYGPPCMFYYTVVSGDTWQSLATRFNARIDVLQEVNPGGLFPGAVIKIPINSAGGSPAQVPVTGGPTITPTATPGITPTPTITPTVTPTMGSGQPTRIQFSPGSTTASVSETLIGFETDSYLVAGTLGQTLTINVVAPVNEVGTRITDPTGFQIKLLDANLIWTGQLSANGDYRIDLVGLTDPIKSYTLTVTLTGP